MSVPTIVPSILAADLARFDREAAAVANVGWLHIDVMDDHFVPNLSFGAPMLAAVAAVTGKYLNIHLMIENPEKRVDTYIKAGVSSVIFHVEAADDAIALVRRIRPQDVKAGFSLRPDAPIEPWLDHLIEFGEALVMSVEPGFGNQSFVPDQLAKVEKLRERIDAEGLDTPIKIDDGTSTKTIEPATTAGCDASVVGLTVFGAENRAAAAGELRALATAAITK